MSIFTDESVRINYVDGCAAGVKRVEGNTSWVKAAHQDRDGVASGTKKMYVSWLPTSPTTLGTSYELSVIVIED